MTDEVWFYNGAVRVDQPKKGYRAGNDAVLLAASVSTKTGEKCLDLGAGSGAVTLLLNEKAPGLNFTAVEKNSEQIRLLRENTKSHDNVEVVENDILDLPKSWHLQFDQVVANPPFFDDLHAIRMSTEKSPSFVNTDTELIDWIAVMLKMLKPRGVGTLILRADSLEKVLHALFGKAGRIRILPIHSFAHEPAKRILIQFRKGVKSESAILPPLIMHNEWGEGKFSTRAAKILCGEMPIDMSA